LSSHAKVRSTRIRNIAIVLALPLQYTWHDCNCLGKMTHAAGCERIFTEKASGAQRDRPQLHAALDYMRADDTLVVWKLDRLARSLRQLLDTVESLHSRHIGLRSLTEAIDTGTPGGTLVFHLFGALAEFERAIIRERTRAGLVAARARGRNG